jgi:hypothetical protein
LMEEDSTSQKTDPKRYASIVMAIYYVALRARPDVLFAVNYLAARTTQCTAKDLKSVFRVLRYLYGTREVALVLKPSGERLHFYVDASFNIHWDGRSHSGLVIALGGDTPSCGLDGAAVCWSGVQKFITISSTEAEMAAVFENHQRIEFFRTLFQEVGFPQEKPILVCQDNDAAILNFNVGFRGRTKPINNRYHYVRELVERRVVEMIRVGTNDMISDALTKPFFSPTLHLPLIQRLMNDPNWMHLISASKKKGKLESSSCAK